MTLAPLLLSLALAQGLTPLRPGQVASGGKVLASFPLATTGALISDSDPNIVAHVYWNGTQLVDTKGNSWTQNGTVPQVTANPFTTTRYGAGPFSDANTYQLGTGVDVLDLNGDMTVCVVYTDTVATGTTHVSNGDYGGSGSGWTMKTSTSFTVSPPTGREAQYLRRSR
jgi:hypothetical protein